VSPFSLDVRCHSCKAILKLTAAREDAPRTKTPYNVACPYCHEQNRGELPVSVLPASIQVALFERPAEHR
jgi:hypothetical protein